MVVARGDGGTDFKVPRREEDAAGDGNVRGGGAAIAEAAAPLLAPGPDAAGDAEGQSVLVAAGDRAGDAEVLGDDRAGFAAEPGADLERGAAGDQDAFPGGDGTIMEDRFRVVERVAEDGRGVGMGDGDIQADGGVGIGRDEDRHRDLGLSQRCESQQPGNQREACGGGRNETESWWERSGIGRKDEGR